MLYDPFLTRFVSIPEPSFDSDFGKLLTETSNTDNWENSEYELEN